MWKRFIAGIAIKLFSKYVYPLIEDESLARRTRTILIAIEFLRKKGKLK